MFHRQELAKSLNEQKMQLKASIVDIRDLQEKYNVITHEYLLFGVLLVDPTSLLDHLPILRSERLAFVMFDVVIQKFVQLRKIEERDHRICMMFGMEVGFPQEPPDNLVRLDSASA